MHARAFLTRRSVSCLSAAPMEKRELSLIPSKNGIPIRLTAERWAHITEEHAELSGRRADLLQTLAEPQRILLGQRGELLALREWESGKWLVVVYREFSDDGFVITAFFTRRVRALEKRIRVWT